MWEKKWNALSNDFCLPQRSQTTLNDIKFSRLDVLFVIKYATWSLIVAVARILFPRLW